MTLRARVCAFAIFQGSCLLFLVEPMVAKRLVPLLGGSAAVWTTCLVFFQTTLLLGYLLAHWLVWYLPSRGQALLYSGLLLAGLAMVLWNTNPALQADTNHPIASVFIVLTRLIGLPFLLLSAAGPLLQAWYSRGFHSEHGAQHEAVPPYRLFALSNFGSLLALIAYPAFIEPRYSLFDQSRGWAVGFVVFVAACIAVLWQSARSNTLVKAARDSVPLQDSPKPGTSDYILWVLLAVCGSVLLCAFTNHLSQNIVSIPLLWILPLTAYLLSFVLVFNGNFYPRRTMLGATAVTLGALAFMLYWDLNPDHSALPVRFAVPLLCVALLVLCIFCHGELYRSRPGALRATVFYLCIAAGGALGSFSVGVLAPLMFPANYEFVCSLVLTTLLGLAVTWRLGLSWRIACAVATTLITVLTLRIVTYDHNHVIAKMRSFYGALRVMEDRIPPQAALMRTLVHGTIEHGTQIFTDELRTQPTTYYGHRSGVGLALDNCCGDRPRRVGVIGLGAGTLAAYGHTGDVFRFYDINPQVEQIARSLFTYTRESKAKVEIVMGDARLSMANEPPQGYDLIVVDAFTGDAVPVHLLTTQAFELYLRHLHPGGILAFHISSQYLNLDPLIQRQGQHEWLNVVLISSTEDDNGIDAADWALATSNSGFLALPEIHDAVDKIKTNPKLRLWTDDYSSLLPVMKWKASPKAPASNNK